MNQAIEDLILEVKECTRCKLHASCSGKVFGEKLAHAPVMVIGEAPGFNEDVTGRPFTGKAGILLDSMMHAIGLSRDTNIFITNILKCRPPDNRNPEPDELKACGDWLEKQIDLIKPKFIIPTGAFSTSWLLGREFDEPIRITHVVGKKYAYKGIPFIPIFHPAYLLRQEDKKQITWEHLQQIYTELDTLGIYQ